MLFKSSVAQCEVIISLFLQPEELDEADHPGFVERQRRSSGIEEVSEDEPTYTLYSLGGAPCIMAKVDAIFHLEYHTLRHGIQTVKVNVRELHLSQNTL